MEIREFNALRGEPVDMRCFHLCCTITAHIRVPKVIREEKDHVWRPFGALSQERNT